MTPAQTRNFKRLLNPRHIAFIGGADASVALNEARRIGFSGQFWPVNPRRDNLLGIPCYAKLADLPEAPDAAYVAIPSHAAVEAVAELNRMGGGGVVCYSAGFKETGGAGVDLEKALVEAAGDMALIGPNCYGVINYPDRVALWPFAHGGGSPGYGAAIITQSGMLSSDITMCQRSLPLTYMVSAGNQAALGLEDFVEVLSEDPRVRAIGLHIEGISSIPRFEEVAIKAARLEKPIVALRTGTSAIGGSLTVSHTGSLSGENELFYALFERLNIIAVQSPVQFLETLKFLTVAGAPKGRRLAGFTCSGGGATMLADRAESIGVDFPAFDGDLAVRLKELLPPVATVSNPLDYTTPIWGQPEYTRPVFEAAIGTDRVDAALLVQDYPAEGLDESKQSYLNDAQAFIAATRTSAIPSAICSTFPENIDRETRDFLIAEGIAPIQGIHEALEAIDGATAWALGLPSVPDKPRQEPLPLPAGAVVTVLDEAEGKRRLRDAGLPVPSGFCVEGYEVHSAAERIGYPVVLKMMGPMLQHKSDVGAVALHLENGQDLSNALIQMRKEVAACNPEAVTDRFLVEAMGPKPVAEVIVGIRRDAQFGLALTLGSGGVLTELIGDVVTLLLPCLRTDLERSLEKLKVHRIIQGYRGGRKGSVDAIVTTLETLCSFALDHADTITEIEVNPLFVYEDRVVIVDVLMQSIDGGR
ncbi:CoA-binding protein [Hwanghaeella grinnelliae]|uniref:CoA-binding protein n=1 Tax=Hwanghaeella grinnelliae TaxID=2500179 RepID=A0A437QVR8_9PROT|nr:acetate--CoA ligase family protein [Hwanghaeella grinnelliae]RVU38617.1 CoA-binding protein [Hwanghaeella grinnelliae]